MASDYQGVRRLTMALLYYGMVGVSIPAAIVLLVLFGISKKSEAIVSQIQPDVRFHHSRWIDVQPASKASGRPSVIT